MENIRNIIINRFVELGWTERKAPTLAAKMYETAVGEKEAIAYIADWKNCFYSIIGTYQSEGSNVLSTGFFRFRTDAEEAIIITAVDEFVKYADASIATTYAVRLLGK